MISKELVKIAVKAIDGHVDNIDLIESGHDSTNVKLRVHSGGKNYILKVSKPGKASPLWLGLEHLFGAKPGMAQGIADLSKAVNDLKLIQVPAPLKYGKCDIGNGEYILLEQLEGEAIHEGSENEKLLSDLDENTYQLGYFMGKIHSIDVHQLGNLDYSTNFDFHAFKLRLKETLKALCFEPWAINHSEVQSAFPSILALIDEMPSSTAIGWIMPSCWPSQFLLDGQKIGAMVNLESYVRGPIALELAVLELWLNNIDMFKKGYEAGGATIPGLSDQERHIYRFLLYLLHGCPPKGLESLYDMPHKFNAKKFLRVT